MPQLESGIYSGERGWGCFEWWGAHLTIENRPSTQVEGQGELGLANNVRLCQEPLFTSGREGAFWETPLDCPGRIAL
jgi:hypothetical protein